MRKLIYIASLLLGLCCVQAQAICTFDESVTSTDLSTVGPITVDSGDLVVLWHKYESVGGSPAVSDGTQSMTVRTLNVHNGNNDLNGFFAYYVAATGGAKTFTVTNATNFFQATVVMEFSCSGTVTFDTDRADAEGTGTAISSGNITTTGSDELVIASYGHYSSATFSNPLINGSAPDATISAGNDRVWYETNAGVFTGDADGTLNSSNAWISNIVAFTVAGGGGGGSSIAVKAMHYRKMTGAQ